MNDRIWLILGAVLAGLSVGSGAFAAHGLDGYFKQKYARAEPREVAGVKIPAAQKYLQDFKTGAEYQMYHALALLLVGLLAQSNRSAAWSVAGWSFLLGTILFSGSLYLLTLTGQRWLGAIVPIGGVLFLVGWAAVAFGVCCGTRS
ncbi:MAG: hypothetical protein JWN70_6794 [Planctomycetaceae bacterium]|nr:hypothetical protein [Planctomycetaceae bacterium]